MQVSGSWESVRRGAACLIAALCLTTWGCGGASELDNQLPTNPAHGLVSFNSMPIPDATLAFHPVESFPGDMVEAIPRAKVDPDGRFVVSTYKAGDGAPAGEYRVAVSWQGPLDGVNDERGDDADLPELLPSRYQCPERSCIRVHIQEGENEIPPSELDDSGEQ